MRFTVFLFFLSCISKSVNSKIVEGSLSTAENWHFITRFCFMSESGTLQYEFEYPESYMTQNLLLYWDHPDLWTSVYRSSLTCEQRQSKVRADYSQLFPLASGYSDCKKYNSTIYCYSNRIPFSTVRERWWFLVFSNCNSKKGLRMKYKIWMRNGEPGDVFFEHFSADEFYILQTDIAFFLMEVTVFVVCIMFAIKLFNKNMFHSTYRMFFLTVLSRCFYLMLSCIRWGVYANTGKHDPGLQHFADIVNVISMLLFVLMLMLMSLGYTIVCGKLPTWIVITLFCFMSGIAVTYIVLFIYEALVFDPGWVLYRYESKPGYGIIGLIILCWVAFIISGLFTAVTHPEKRKFYIPFLIFYTIWFWAVPTLVFVSIWNMALWMRMKIVNGVECTIIFLGHLFYLFLTRPVDSNHNFPYHIRTQQIDTITLEQATEKALETDSLQRQSFNPDIFTVQGGSGDSPSTTFQQPKVTNPFLAEETRPSSQQRSARETMTSLSNLASSSTGESDAHPQSENSRPAEGQAPIGEDFYVPRNIDSLFSFPSTTRS